MKIIELLTKQPVPKKPFFVFRQHLLEKTISYFRAQFSGEVLYAIKANPDINVLNTLYNNGIKHFDAASLNEIKLIFSNFKKANIYFMNPVKSRHEIHDAYFKYGVRHFSIDTNDELDKILEETSFAKDINFHVRLKIQNSVALHSLANKFGASFLMAKQILIRAVNFSKEVGVCFHVGSQCMDPSAYTHAIEKAMSLINQLDINISSLNIGGGFPSIYSGITPPPLHRYFKEIFKSFSKLKISHPHIQFLSEPGRSLVAESTSLVVRVLLRKDNTLYLNDGAYGALFDAAHLGITYPVRLIRTMSNRNIKQLPFQFYGPTCDSLDYIKGPFYLPEDIKEGDYIEIGQMGAYSQALASGFNGFSHHKEIFLVDDEPLLTLYDHHLLTKTHDNMALL